MIERLHSAISKGRKSNDVVIAATQTPSAEVLPTIIRSQFVQVCGLRMARRETTRMVFGDGSTDQYDLSTIPVDQPGRGIWFDGSRMTRFRAAGLWGRPLREQALRRTDYWRTRPSAPV